MAISANLLGQIEALVKALEARVKARPAAPVGGATPPAGTPAPAAPKPMGDLRLLNFGGGHATSVPLPPPASALPPSSSSIPSPGAPSSPNTPPTPTSAPVLLLGNKKRPRTIESFLKTMQKRGYPLPFDPATLDPQVLKTTVPKGHTVALSHDGKLVGMTTTDHVMADENLGLQNHLKHGSETHTTGGDVVLDGKRLDVSQSFLKSPIMLDLTGDGKLGTTGVSTAKGRVDAQIGKTVQFDIDGDGDADEIEWMDGQGDGMLVDDTDGGATAAMHGDGTIDGTRLFGDQGGKYANGYDKLALRDADGDGRLTGQELAGLKVWVDDGDAKVEAGELKTLAELGVTELGARMHTEKNARGEDLMRSTMVRNGRSQVTEDVWFRAAGA